MVVFWFRNAVSICTFFSKWRFPSPSQQLVEHRGFGCHTDTRGYYFTSRALTQTEASRVQMIETSDPLFSSAFAFVFFDEVLSTMGLLGAGTIFVGILLLISSPAPLRS